MGRTGQSTAVHLMADTQEREKEPAKFPVPLKGTLPLMRRFHSKPYHLKFLWPPNNDKPECLEACVFNSPKQYIVANGKINLFETLPFYKGFIDNL